MSNFVGYWYIFLQTKNFFTIIFDNFLKKNGHTFTNPFRFPEEIFKEDPNLYMASLYVDTLFANIPLDETIEKF